MNERKEFIGEITVNNMGTAMENENYAKPMRISAILIIIGAALSGPVGTIISYTIKPQPPWNGIETFIQNYHPAQIIPFVFGFLLLAGFVLFISTCFMLADGKNKLYATAALIFTAIFATIVFIDYTVQIAYIPNAFNQEKIILSVLTMYNPNSIGWVLELFAYGALGAATWLVAPVFSSGKTQEIIRYLLSINGIVSIAGAGVTAIDISWVSTIPGLISYVLWNILIVVIMIFVLIEYKRV